MLKYTCMNNQKICKNILLIGLSYNNVQEMGTEFSNFANFYYLDVEALIDYAVMDRVKMKQVCGAKYLEEQESKVVASLQEYENTVISMKFSTMVKYFEFVNKLNCIKVYLYLEKEDICALESKNKLNNGLNDIVFEERNKFLKKNCDILFKCDINNMKYSKLLSEIQAHLSEGSSEN